MFQATHLYCVLGFFLLKHILDGLNIKTDYFVLHFDTSVLFLFTVARDR